MPFRIAYADITKLKVDAIVSETVAKIRKGCMVEEDWCAEIAEDFKARQK